MPAGGYIKIWRKIKNHPYWKEPRQFSKFEAWMDLVMTAAGIDFEVPYRDQLIKLKRGQMIIATRKLAERWGWSRERVHRFLANCVYKGEIRYHRRDHRFSIISIVKYATYNPPADSGRTKNETTGKTTGKTTDETKINKDKRSNKIKNKEGHKEPYPYLSLKNDVIFKWNDFAREYNLAAIIDIKSKSVRDGNLKARSSEKNFNFDLLLDIIKNSPFLLGKTKHGFFVFFDWIIKPTNYQKIIEGNYLDRQSYQKFSGIIEGIKDLKKENKNGPGRS